jgi:hypothetical protein
VSEYLSSSDVTAEYVYWMMEEEKVRAYLRNTNKAMDAWLTAQWEQAETDASEIFDPERHDAGLEDELFMEAVGIRPADYFWQLSAAVIKDACTLYEVFLERSAQEVLRRVGASLSTSDTDDSWRWDDCEVWYQHYVGVDVRPPKLAAALWIRNKLTHLRNEIKTNEGRSLLRGHLDVLGGFEPPSEPELALGLVEHGKYLHNGLALSQLQTLRVLDAVRDTVNEVALAVFPYVYRSTTNPYLTALQSKQPIGIPKLKRTLLTY